MITIIIIIIIIIIFLKIITITLFNIINKKTSIDKKIKESKSSWHPDIKSQ